MESTGKDSLDSVGNYRPSVGEIPIFYKSAENGYSCKILNRMIDSIQISQAQIGLGFVNVESFPQQMRK
jgi:hypothetical protein